MFIQILAVGILALETEVVIALIGLPAALGGVYATYYATTQIVTGKH